MAGRPAGRPLAGTPTAAKRRRRAPIDRKERGIEAPDAAKTGGKGDLGQPQTGLIQQALGALDPQRGSNLARRGTGVPKKQPQQVPRPDPERGCQRVNRAVIEKASFDQVQAARDRGGRAGPGRTARCALGTAAQARAKASPLCCSGGRKERDVGRFCRPYRTNRAAIDSRRPHAREEPAVKAAIPRQSRGRKPRDPTSMPARLHPPKPCASLSRAPGLE
jgi:hypothetical protein